MLSIDRLLSDFTGEDRKKVIAEVAGLFGQVWDKVLRVLPPTRESVNLGAAAGWIFRVKTEELLHDRLVMSDIYGGNRVIEWSTFAFFPRCQGPDEEKRAETFGHLRMYDLKTVRGALKELLQEEKTVAPEPNRDPPVTTLSDAVAESGQASSEPPSS